MSILGYFFQAAALVVDLALGAYLWIVIARAVLSWVNPDPYNPIVRFLYNATDPVLNEVRRRLPLAVSGMDFSPVVVILAIYFLRHFVVNSLGVVAGMFF